MCTRPVVVRLPPNPYEYSQGIRSDKVLTVPCGKCAECLSKRQNDVAIRCYREAQKFGSCHFVTLTYAPHKVPIAQTLLACDMSTGEVCIEKCSELCSAPILSSILDEYHDSGINEVFYHYEHLCDYEGISYDIVYTPTLNYRDVQLCIKNFRVKFAREFSEKLTFSYIAVGEYGHKRSHRPHYHLLFFGLTEFQVRYFMDLWSAIDTNTGLRVFGRSYLRSVNFVNKDGSDGLAKVASYVGKYSSKGSFNPSSVLSHYTLPCRISSSRGLGMDNINRLYSYYRAYDVAGVYDIELMNTDYDRMKLYDIILSRLSYEFNGYKFSLPLSLRRKIFSYRLVDGRACWSRLYYEVMDYARTLYSDISDRKFRAFLGNYANKPLSEVVLLFESFEKNNLLLREQTKKKHLSDFYSKSKF